MNPGEIANRVVREAGLRPIEFTARHLRPGRSPLNVVGMMHDVALADSTVVTYSFAPELLEPSWGHGLWSTEFVARMQPPTFVCIRQEDVITLSDPIVDADSFAATLRRFVRLDAMPDTCVVCT